MPFCLPPLFQEHHQDSCLLPALVFILEGLQCRETQGEGCSALLDSSQGLAHQLGGAGPFLVGGGLWWKGPGETQSRPGAQRWPQACSIWRETELRGRFKLFSRAFKPSPRKREASCKGFSGDILITPAKKE